MLDSSPSRRARSLLAKSLLFIVTSSVALAGNGFSQLVVFGDSLNDTSNMVELTGGVFPAPPAYAYGRQSNGPVWVEYLADQLGLADHVVNYAVAGAMTRPAPAVPTGNVFSNTFAGLEGTDVTSQVLDYLEDANWTADPAALYVLEGGSNDFPRVADPSVIVAHLLQSLVALQMSGAKHILLVTLPDLGKTPRVVLGELTGQLPPGTSAFVSAATAQLNQALLAWLPAYTLPGVTITIGDMHSFLNDVVASPAAYGLTNVTEPYLMFGAGEDPSTWLFWDDVHPTTVGHRIFAERAAASLLRTYSPGQGRQGKGAINSLKGLVKVSGR
jgi:phospholipase/lecithinase/hemolysin